jgi:hypothetical protein
VHYLSQNEQGTGYTLPYYEARAKKRKSGDVGSDFVIDLSDDSFEFD